ncbi:hypothetical protein BJ878DRAFT_531477 [Calycina marina]|uniref:GCS light chain n=1 Tax=Calycina marina TaxID=1763456 RepID=A0A9P7ZBD9_9HELO|nr:hypothetical protein BJ878DRAFT_531477 [Calycina marina]
MTRLILSTSNIVMGGSSIVRQPGTDKSNFELTNSLRANFVAAQEDYSPPQSETSGNTPTFGSANGAEAEKTRPQLSIWTTREGSDYYVPTIDWSLSGVQEEPSQYEITVKLFYLPGASIQERAKYTKDAVELVLKELKIQTIDLLIISFHGLTFDGDCEWRADKINASQGNDEEEIQSWAAVEELHSQGIVKRLGLAEYGSEKLSKFLESVKVPPQVDQINLKDCCNVPPPLIQLAKAKGIELLTHRDCTDILPKGTLREILGQGPQGAGLLSVSKRGLDGMKGEITPQWVVKYTAVVRDRGVIENKGYFAVAELAE